MRILALFLFFLALSICHSFDCTCEKSPTVEEINNYRKLIDSLLETNKKNLELWKKCVSENAPTIERIAFKDGRFTLKKSGNISFAELFQNVTETQRNTCGSSHERVDELPSSSYVDQSRNLRKLYDLNPIIFEKLASAWKTDLQSANSYLNQCAGKETIFSLNFFKHLAPGNEIEDLQFLPKSNDTCELSFEYKLSTGNAQTPPLVDFLKYVENHYITMMTTFTFSEQHESISLFPLTHTEDPRGPQGFQLHFKRENNNFLVVKSMRIRAELDGDLEVFVLDKNRRIRDRETVKGVKTDGSQWISLNDINLNIQNKDYIMFDYIGLGAFAKRSLNQDFQAYQVNNALSVSNVYIRRDNLGKDRKDHQFEVDNCSVALEVEFSLVKKENAERRKSPTVRFIKNVFG